jgi:hypothetical protein
MGNWTDAYERLRDLSDSGASIEEIEEAAAKELNQLLDGEE